MLTLTSLRRPLSAGQANGISNLKGLEYAANLTELNLRYHRISDVSPLAGLPHLRSLDLLGNQLRDISPLSGLPELESLDLESNQITDISALAELPSLSSLCLHRNFVHTISPLANLTSLRWVDLRALPLDQDAYSTYIPQIKANNPGVTILYSGPFERRLTISSSVGGTVVEPGEGTFGTTYGETWLLEAKADPGFMFAGWSGTYSTPRNPLPLIIDQDYTLQANFVSTLQTIHVDDDAPRDPGPADPALSDPGENGTSESPLDSICEAIGVASTGSVIVVHAGTYHETIDFLGKAIELTGFDSNDRSEASRPVIDGGDKGPVVNFTRGEDESCRLTGLVITGGKARSGAAIRCVGSSPTVAHCLVTGNRATDGSGAVILCDDSNATFVNCTIAENRGGRSGAALLVADSRVTVVNSIIWGGWPSRGYRRT